MNKPSAMRVALAAAVLAGSLSMPYELVLAAKVDVVALEELGKRVFFDPISRPRGKQSCSSCHDPRAGWTGPNSKTNETIVAQPGAAFHKDPFAIGSLKPPANAYASFIRPFSDSQADCTLGPPQTAGFCGGNFWNGRAEGSGALRSNPLYPGATQPIFDDELFTINGVFDDDLNDAYQQFLGPVAEQALNPFPNPVEQNIEEKAVCKHVQRARYAELYKFAWGEPITCNTEQEVDKAFKRIAVALAAYQSSDEVNSFSSKRDTALKLELACLAAEQRGITLPLFSKTVCQHPNYKNSKGTFPLVGLTALENYGHDLFYASRFSPIPRQPGNPIPQGTKTVCDPAGISAPKSSNCAFCHSDNPGTDHGAEPEQLYADDHYHNIGAPANHEIPNASGPNPGLAGHTLIAEQTGFFKTPTLRNVDKRPNKRFVKAYGHNGWFKSLESIVHFYNTAYTGTEGNIAGKIPCPDGIETEGEALAANCWPEPEHPNAAIPVLIGNLGLSACDESAIVAYMKTLSDQNSVRSPSPYKPR